MYCKCCGYEILETGKFCPNCGTSATPQNKNQINQEMPKTPENSTIQKAPYNVFSILGLVVSGISLFINFWGLVGMAGIILSVIGLSQIGKKHENGKVLAISGTIIGVLSVLYAFIILI